MRDEWYVARRGQGGSNRYGPVPLAELRGLVDQGKVRGEDLVWTDGMANWRRADQCDAVFPPPRRGHGRPAYGPEDDDGRPYRRRRSPRRQPSGVLTVLLVVGGVIGLCLMGCAGLGFMGYMNLSSSATSYSPAPTPPPTPVPTQPPPPPDGMIFDPAPGAPLNGLGHAIPYGLSELYYTDNVLPTEAQVLATYLNNQGFFPIDHGVTVQLDKDGNGVYRVRFCLKDGAPFDPDVHDFYSDLRDQITDAVFPGLNVEADLCNANMDTVRTIKAGD